MLRYRFSIITGLILVCCLLGFATMASAAPKRAPSVEVSLDRTVINSGEKVSVTWGSKYAKYCFISHGVGLVKRKGTIELNPDKTTTYTITAYGTKWRSNLSDEEKKAHEVQTTFTVRVEGVKPSVSFASNTTSIYEGDSITLSWNTDYTDTVSINQGIGSVGSKGSLDVTPQQTTEYTLTARGPGGVVIQKVSVKVNKRAE